MENVVGSPLRPDLTLCGHMFGLALYRHRIFEVHGAFVWQPEHRKHVTPGSRAGHWRPGQIISVSGNCSPISLAREAMDIDWMTRSELVEAIPPAYSLHIGTSTDGSDPGGRSMTARRTISADAFTRKWVCMVNRSGYCNGPGCTPNEGHGGDWGCGWRNELHLSYTDEKFAEVWGPA